jgi:Tfp pilus assembly protein PilN
MPSINLAPGTQYIIAARKRRVRLYGIAVITVIVFVGAWGALYVYHQSLLKSDADVQTKIQTANAQIQALHDDAVRVSLFEKRLVEIKTLLDTHVNWSPVFADLEKLLPSDTVLTNFDATSNSPTITLQGVTSQIDQVSLAIASLSAGDSHPSVFKSGSIKSIQRQEQKNGDVVSVAYSFTMVVTFDPKILWQ